MFSKILDARINDLWNFYLASGEINHSGEKGMFREAFVGRLLQTLLPIQFGLGSGVIVDGWERQSMQADLLIYDRRTLPPFMEERGHGIYPIDSVLRVLEVKSRLDANDLERYAGMCWRLNPDNPDGLRIAKHGTLEGNQTSYPLLGLYAYETSINQFKFENDWIKHCSGFVCVASKGVFVPSTGLALKEESNIAANTRLFIMVFLEALEATAKSRGDFGLSEWIDL